MKRIQEFGTSACLVLVVFLTIQTVTTAIPVDKTDIEIEHVIDGEDDVGEVDKRARFSRILRSGTDGTDNEEAYDRILRGASFSRILRSPTSSFSRILRGRPGSFSRILRSPRSFSRILRAKPSSFSRILRSPQVLLEEEATPPRPSRSYARILRADPYFEHAGVDDDADVVDELGKRSSGFSRILRDSFSRIL